MANAIVKAPTATVKAASFGGLAKLDDTPSGGSEAGSEEMSILG